MLRSTLLPPLSSFPSHLKTTFPSTLPHHPPTVCKNSPSTIPPPPTVCKNSPLASSAYIHLPFCRKRCHYCDFPIIALGSSSPSPPDDPRISNYINLLLQEINFTTPFPTPLRTIFFGGGTPSLIPPSLLSSLLRSLGPIDPTAEISIEMDPGTFDTNKLNDIVALGINRVSLGVQAFQEGLLRTCGRAHGLEEVEVAIEIVKGCEGLRNWSLDLISSLPGQSEGMWEESLRRAVVAGPTHVSVYDLQVEQGTKFGNL